MIAIPLPRIELPPLQLPAMPRRAATQNKRPALGLLDWMHRYRAQLKPDVPFDLHNHHYLRAIYADTSRQMIVCKSGQAGASEYLVSYALHACDQRAATVLYVFPTDTHVSDFSAARMGPAIESSDYLSKVVVEAREAGGKRGADRVTLKRVRNRFLYFRGGKVKPDGNAPQLKSIDADVLILDELDELDPRAVNLADKRLGHSAIGETRMASTPTYPGRGIHSRWLESDQRLWHIPCPGCGHRQPLTIDHAVIEWDDLGRPVAWHGQDEGRAYCACANCHAELDRLAQGEWVATYPEQPLVGYHLSKLFSAQNDILSIVNNLNTVDDSKRKEAFNQDLGLTYTPRGGSLDDEILDACRRDYAHAPSAPGACYMGVDVGKVLHVIIRAAPDVETGERRQLFAGETSWDGLGRLMRQYDPRTVVIDGLPETTKAREFQAEWPRRKVFIAYYASQTTGPKREESALFDPKELVAHLDRTRTLDETFGRFMDGSNTLPADIRSVRDYYGQLKSPVRVLELNAQGVEVARYVESGPDHYAHAENYCAAASVCRLTPSSPRKPMSASFNTY